jgi:hypothetical protein
MNDEEQQELYSKITQLIATCTCENLVGEVLEDLQHIRKYCDNISDAFLKGIISKLEKKQ